MNSYIQKRSSPSKCNSPLIAKTCSSFTASFVFVCFFCLLLFYWGTLILVKQCRCFNKDSGTCHWCLRVPLYFMSQNLKSEKPTTREERERRKSGNVAELPFNAESQRLYFLPLAGLSSHIYFLMKHSLSSSVVRLYLIWFRPVMRQTCVKIFIFLFSFSPRCWGSACSRSQRLLTRRGCKYFFMVAHFSDCI